MHAAVLSYGSMEVFLIPVGHGRHELYCEVREDGTERADDPPPAGRIGKIRARLREMIADAEARSKAGDEASPPQPHESWMERSRHQMFRWIAEKIAEQRLLWHLRRQDQATLVYPEDMRDTDALRVLCRSLERDLSRHRRWLVIDSLLFVASGLLVLLPGPNVVAYYFLFRLVGHYLSMQGARQGLQQVSWQTRASAALQELGRAATLDPSARGERVQHVATELQLQHLVQFFERTAVTS